MPYGVEILPFTLGPVATNCYVLADPDGSCLVVDAGWDPEPMIEAIQARSLRPALIALTHAHWDHIAGLETLREAFPNAPVAIHPSEQSFLQDPAQNLSGMFGMPMTARAADRLFEPGEILSLGNSEWTVKHTPGHSPGSVSLVSPQAGAVIAGDTLFSGSIGRHDFPHSNVEHLERSIRDTLYALPDDTQVWPGHGPKTTIGHEKRTNPFVRAD